MKSKFGAICAMALLTLAGSAAAQVTLPPGTQITPQQQLPLPRGGWRPTLPALCQVDPAIVSVTLTKGTAARSVTISYEVRNLGRSAWTSGANQQNVGIVARNANTGRAFRASQNLPGAAAAGARMLAFTTPAIPEAFDDFEWGGTVDVIIGYDPDIYIDSNDCNDDSNSANNRVHIDYAVILGFMRGTARTQTFRPS